MENSSGCIKKLQRAFTLIELMVVVAIIGVLATISMPMYSDYIDRARAAQAIQDIGAISKQITVYSYFNGGRYPGSLAEIGLGGMLDPWGNPYQYLNLSDPNLKGKGKARKDHNLVPINSDYDLFSMGKDGASASPLTANASRDDIVRANNGRFVGRAKDY
ncbi:MAG: prepilin-type N-terminal cleavage/methylation domain-containing protein [Burkholderiales bacterium]|nr:prepilin-type N-terminal cleavage/methylation domain-containing protein [Burkholderiales bacterium]MDR4517861.1 prepilin-type N-terminal cleavage/methylation domain-containing protein [Nitrosomonas sp.]